MLQIHFEIICWAAAASAVCRDEPFTIEGNKRPQLPLGETKDVPKDFRPALLEIVGDYLYAGACVKDKPAVISYLKRSPDGTLAYGGTVSLEEKRDHFPGMCAAGGRLYVLYGCWGSSIICYDIDSVTGKPVQKGVNVSIKGEWAGSLIADREGKNLYMWVQERLLWFKIGADGQLEKGPK